MGGGVGYRAIAWGFFSFFFLFDIVPVQAVCIYHSGFFPEYFYVKSVFVKIYLCTQSFILHVWKEKV